MSLLGFDALGKLPLGGIPSHGGINAIMPAFVGSFNLSGRDGPSRVRQASEVGSSSLAGEDVNLHIAIVPKVGGYIVTGDGVAYSGRFVAASFSHTVSGAAASLTPKCVTSSILVSSSGSDSLFRVRQTSGIGSALVVGPNVDLGISLVSQINGYLITGIAAAFVREVGTIDASSASYIVSVNTASFVVLLGGDGNSQRVTGYDASYTRGFENWLPISSNGNAWTTVPETEESWAPKQVSPHNWSELGMPLTPWTAATNQPESWNRK